MSISNLYHFKNNFYSQLPSFKELTELTRAFARDQKLLRQALEKKMKEVLNTNTNS